MFNTLQDLMLHNKSVTYVLMGLVLLCFVGFWRFLTDKEERKRRY
jgi:hypothetical protein